jgi:hypothetical protein
LGLLLLGLLLLATLPSLAQLSTLETNDQRLVYIEPMQSYLAPHMARCFENSMAFQRKLFGYSPWEKVTVLTKDFVDDGNASASPIPRNFLGVEIAPVSFAYETYPSNERINTLMNHELVHITAFDQAAGRDRFCRKLFSGKVTETPEHPETMLYNYLTVPRAAAPRWYHEGLAVFVETWMAGGIGRAQGSYDEMVFRSMVRDGSRFYDPLGLVSEGTKIDFQVEMNSYLYGTRFMTYVADRYSPEELIRWVRRSEGSKAYYATQFRQVFGSSLKEVWREWVEWERGFQQKNLDLIRKYPVTPYEDLSDKALGSVSRAFLDRDRKVLYAAFNYPGVVAHVGAISLEDGSARRIRDVKGPLMHTVASLAYDPGTDTLFYTTDNAGMRDLVTLDPATGKIRRMIKDGRIGDLVFDRARRALWGIRHQNGIATLVRIDEPYDDWKQVHSFDYGTVVYDLDVSPDGRLLSASVAEIDGRHSLRVMTVEALERDDTTPIAELDFGTTIPSNFVFSSDGAYLYGSSYYTGVSNIFRFEIATKEFRALTNTETGMFRPLPMDDGTLIVFRYTGEGFVPARIRPTPLEDVSAITFFGQQVVEKHPVLESWKVGSPRDIPLESMITKQGPYRPFGGIGLESWYPIVEGYKDSAAAGVSARFSDPLGFNRMTFTASYTPGESLPSEERFHFKFDYRRYDWRVALKYNAGDFYDLFGPTKVGRKGYSAGVGYSKTLISDEPKNLEMDLSAAYHGDIDTLPDYQNVEATIDELASVDASLSYRNTRASLGAVDSEKGIRAETIAACQYVNGRYIPSLLGNFDAGAALPLHHSSIWLRSSAGVTGGDIEDPFASFYFGGFGNNYVDHLEIKRFRQYYAFPGVELNSIGGQTYAKTMIEWNLPPLRFRSAGSPGFYASWLRTSLFTTGIATNFDDGEVRRKLVNAGVQIDVRFTALARQDLTLSAGYAVAFESGLPSTDELMASLKILR